MLVDAKHNEHEFGGDTRHDDSHNHREEAENEKDHADKWIINHRGERADHAGKTEQNGNHDRQPIEDLNHSGRDESLPLEKITKTEHTVPPSRGFMGRPQTALCASSGQSRLIARLNTCFTLFQPMPNNQTTPATAFVDGSQRAI